MVRVHDGRAYFDNLSQALHAGWMILERSRFGYAVARKLPVGWEYGFVVLTVAA